VRVDGLKPLRRDEPSARGMQKIVALAQDVELARRRPRADIPRLEPASLVVRLRRQVLLAVVPLEGGGAADVQLADARQRLQSRRLEARCLEPALGCGAARARAPALILARVPAIAVAVAVALVHIGRAACKLVVCRGV